MLNSLNDFVVKTTPDFKLRWGPGIILVRSSLFSFPKSVTLEILPIDIASSDGFLRTNNPPDTCSFLLEVFFSTTKVLLCFLFFSNEAVVFKDTIETLCWDLSSLICPVFNISSEHSCMVSRNENQT